MGIKKIIKKIIGVNRIVNYRTKQRFKQENEFKRALAPNEEFHNKYKGKRCFVLGNGPSLKTIDFFKLKDEYTFTVNQLARNPRFDDLKTNFHMWADERFFDLDANKPGDMELLSVMRSVASSENHPVVFYKYAAHKMVEKFKLDSDLDIRYYEEAAFDRSMIDNWNADFTKLVYGFSTVVHYIICLAIYMGFEEIILLGCDCTGFMTIAQTKLGNAEKAEYSYKVTENEKKRMERVQNKTSIRDELSWYVSLFDEYKILDQFCKKNNVRLVNATNPTLLETVERVDFDSLFE